MGVSTRTVAWNSTGSAPSGRRSPTSPEVTSWIDVPCFAAPPSSVGYRRLSSDAILLDVDNGPEGLTRKANDWLYARPGLQAAFAAIFEQHTGEQFPQHPREQLPTRLRGEFLESNVSPHKVVWAYPILFKQYLIQLKLQDLRLPELAREIQHSLRLRVKIRQSISSIGHSVMEQI